MKYCVTCTFVHNCKEKFSDVCMFSEDTSLKMDYEESRKEIINQRKRFLENLGIIEEIHSIEPPKKVKPVRQKRKVADVEVVQLRRSRRLEMQNGISYDNDEMQNLQQSFEASANKLTSNFEEYKRPEGALRMLDCCIPLQSSEKAEDVANLSTLFGKLKMVEDTFNVSDWTTSDRILEQLSNLSYRERLKLVRSRIYSLCIHPSNCRILVTAGDKNGRIGFADLTDHIADVSEAPTWQFAPHSAPVNCIRFAPDPTKLFSCSYDGSARYLDLEAGVFEEVRWQFVYLSSYSAKYNNRTTAQFRYLWTTRPAKQETVRFECWTTENRQYSPSGEELFRHSINTGVHFFLFTNFKCPSVNVGKYRLATIWDLRKLKNPVSELKHKGGVNSAYFSPLTGNKVLTAAASNTIEVWDTKKMTKTKKLKSIPHNNFVGRWVTNFRPVWHPTVESVCFSGSTNSIRHIEVFDENLRAVKLLGVTTMCSIIDCHPGRAILCGGNSSGYVSVFI
ncbi:putative WD repeat-containing protein 76 [Trichinella spiralis]|uniref:WD repeat-containing protein 76 n=1 Tax=Trichinella spiralis TaxID=6334 RepID=E5S1J5_TRISP|nr:putative WD repeat-containing protein 76 [Trichinella spiralis]KRY39821.1 WD repeat-containing protein 76 [Trichinella spiralis]